MLEAKKYSIIEWVISLADEKVIDTIQSLKERVEGKSEGAAGKIKKTFTTSTYREIKNRKIDVEQLKVDQRVQLISPEELKNLSVEANIEQSIDELLFDLKGLG